MMQSLKSEKGSIASCPAEILLLVLELQSPAEWRTLCLVNRHFRAIAERLLYSKVQWSWEDPGSLPPIVPSLQTILSRPELAAHVTNIQLEGRYLPSYAATSPINSIPVSGTALDQGIKFIQRTGVPYDNYWIQQLRKSVLDALVALLLAQLPNLRQLDLGPVFLQRSTLIGMVLGSAICEPGVYQLPHFPYLMDVSVVCGFVWDWARKKENVQNTPDCLPLFYLPNLERMSVSIRSSATFQWPVAYLPDPSRLKSLELLAIREAHLIDILSVTKSLEKLSWMWYYDFGLDDQFNKPIVNLDQIGSALSRIPTSLTELNISAEVGIGGNDCWYPGVIIKGSLHQLADLDHVKRVKIPLAFVVGFAQDTSKTLQDKMPKNLEFLTLTYDLGIQEDPLRSPEMPEFDWEDWAVLGLIQSWLEV